MTEPSESKDVLQQIMFLLEERNGFLQDDRDHEVSEVIREEILAHNLLTLRHKLDSLHPADVAHLLESLPLTQRLDVWEWVKTERDGDILLEVSDAVRQTLIADMDAEELLAATEQLDTDEIADLAPDLPKDVLDELLESLDSQNREHLQLALAYADDTVGALMDFDVVTIREDVSLEVTLRYLRRLGNLPSHTDKLFVVDRQGGLCGVLPLKRMVVEDIDKTVHEVMITDTVVFYPQDLASDAAQAFGRYDLITAPVTDEENKLKGRITVDAIMDFIRDQEISDKLSMAGLRSEEDLFAPIMQSIKNRWAWLAINLVTAFIASRVIGLFAGSIEKIVALATLMPIVAGIGGNSGNQTISMIVRGLALGQITLQHLRILLTKELRIAFLNGLIWGGVLAIMAYVLYDNWALGLVIMVAMMLNFLLAAIMGVLIPLLMNKLGRDPAVGSSVLITAMTDSGGFFIFLGLATLFLV